MIIDLRTILHGPRRFDFSFQEDWWQGDEETGQIIGIDGPLNVHMSIYRVGSRYALEGQLTGRLRVMCGRCLEPFSNDLESEFKLFLAPSPPDTDQIELELSEDDLSTDVIEGNELNLDDIVSAQVYLSLPMKLICREDCLGLCPVCGTNLNMEKCNCLHDKGHPGLSKLKNLKLK